jgi:predicted RNA-binding protein YlxR (DUF448 family)
MPRHLIRSCVGCRRRGVKSEFIRVVRSPEGIVSLDPAGRSPGRGAYLCPSPRCLKQALKGGRLTRALRSPVGEAVLAALEAAVRCETEKAEIGVE